MGLGPFWGRAALAGLCALLVLAGVLAPQLGMAQSQRSLLVQKGVPPELAGWVPWVLHGQGDADCPKLNATAVCVWPTELALDVRGNGGRFALGLFVDSDSHVSLPGAGARWPLQVSLDGRPAAVLNANGVPRIWVTAGAHRVEGRFTWPRVPESLAMPSAVGQVALTMHGKPVVAPRREADGRLWLGAGASQAVEKQGLEIEVSRRVQDGVPLTITTRLTLAVGGKAREVVLPTTLVPGSWPIDVSSTLPAQLDPDGTLHLQLAAGQHQVQITALAPVTQSELKPAVAPTPWPAQETWVWVPNSELRQVELSDAPHLDPSRTNLAPDWQGLSTYLVTPALGLVLESRRRGEAHTPPNQLRVERELWLDVDGTGLTVSDKLSGRMSTGWRLNLIHGELGRLSVDGVNQLITTREDRAGQPGQAPTLRGVELRGPDVNGSAEWRLPTPGLGGLGRLWLGALELDAVAWSEDLDGLSMRLNLPPGYELLAATGPDDVSGAWVSRWDLWSFFFVLLVGLATAKLCGWGWGALALLALGLSYHEPGAPGPLFLLLLVAVALSRLALSGWAVKAVRGLLFASLGLMFLSLAPFAIDQVRLALYPQLGAEPGRPSAGDPLQEAADLAVESEMEEGDQMMPAVPAMAGRAATGEAAAHKPVLLTESISKKAVGKLSPRSRRPASRPAKRRRKYDQLPAGSAVQTGPGLPTWSHNRYRLGWSGPVQQGQRLSLWLMPPPVSRGLALLRILLLVGLLFALVRHSGLGSATGKSGGPSGTGGSVGSGGVGAVATVLLVGLLGLTLGLPRPASADAPAKAMPTNELLTELRTRLLAPPPCAPDCLSVTQLDVRVDGARLTTQAQVHAGTVMAYQAPGPLAQWAPDRVRVDGKPALGSARLDGGFLYVRVPEGRHTVELSGPIAGGDALTLQLGSAPHRVQVQAPGWAVDGLRADGGAAGSVQLTRKLDRPTAEVAETKLSPWLAVERVFEFESRFAVQTTLRRVGDLKGAVLLHYPLLAGESVTDQRIEVSGKIAVLRMAPGQAVLRFASRLAQPTAAREKVQLELQAPGLGARKNRPWSETWRVACATFYACQAEGLTPVSRVQSGRVVHSYRPYPGEKLKVTLRQLAGAPGASSTVDKVQLEVRPGAQASQASLSLRVRSSAGATSRVALPAAASLGEVTVDGQARSVRQIEGALEVALEPGVHRVRIAWRQPGGLGLHFEVPAVRVRGPLVNVNVQVQVPEDRWLLWVYGPDWGPAILFWGYLLLALGLAVAVARVPNTPLRTHQWMLLVLGLTQVDAAAAMLVVGWFFAMVLRAKWAPPGKWKFNVVQLWLAFLTVMAAAVLADAVREGLVVQPDMQVAGARSSMGSLSWYVDRLHGSADSQLPTPGIVSLPLWVYKGLMLAWALWLALSALGWLRWGWQAFSSGGRWRRSPPNAGKPRPTGSQGRAPAPQPVISGKTLPPNPPQETPAQASSSADAKPGPPPRPKSGPPPSDDGT